MIKDAGTEEQVKNVEAKQREPLLWRHFALLTFDTCETPIRTKEDLILSLIQLIETREKYFSSCSLARKQLTLTTLHTICNSVH